MKEAVIAARYARGLAECAHEKGELRQVREDVDILADLMDPNFGEISVPELLDFLRSPTIPQADKIKVTDVICEKMSIGKTVSDFLNVLIENNRIGITGLIARAFDRIAGEYEHTKIAEVESAKPLSDSHKKMLAEAIKEALGGEVRLLTKRNPELLGGLKVKIGDLLLDGSLSGRLERIEASLKG